jgi:hypothetical protein
MLDCEILIDAPMAQRGKRMLQAIADVTGGKVTRHYYGRKPWLVMYGVGLDQRQRILRYHLKHGGRVAVWDLGYWDREQSMRLSINGQHPTSAMLAASPAEPRRVFELREDADPSGPILLCGMGDKSATSLGLPVGEWERKALKHLKATYPSAPIWWRPKGRVPRALPGAHLAHGTPIEDALRGCSMIYCAHSNVAVDACIAGVPVICSGGAAAALYADNPAPSAEQRREFLARLSWWNWAPSEAAQAVQFIGNMQ